MFVMGLDIFCEVSESGKYAFGILVDFEATLEYTIEIVSLFFLYAFLL